MKFCISTIEFWESVGFNTENWRVSTDGLKSICHEKFARLLVEDLDTNSNIETHDIDSVNFKAIIENEFTGDFRPSG